MSVATRWVKKSVISGVWCKIVFFCATLRYGIFFYFFGFFKNISETFHLSKSTNKGSILNEFNLLTVYLYSTEVLWIYFTYLPSFKTNVYKILEFYRHTFAFLNFWFWEKKKFRGFFFESLSTKNKVPNNSEQIPYRKLHKNGTILHQTPLITLFWLALFDSPCAW